MKTKDTISNILRSGFGRQLMLIMCLLTFLLTACSAETFTPPRHWPVAEVNGIRPESFSLDGCMEEDGPSLNPISLLNFITPHAPNEVEYDNADICYRGGGSIGNKVFGDAFIIGYPICAFSCEGESYLISQYPLYSSSRRGSDRIGYGYFLYTLRDGKLLEMVSSMVDGGLGGSCGNGHLPLSYTQPRAEHKLEVREQLLTLLPRLRFTESHLNYFAAQWYFDEVCGSVSNLESPESERRLKLMLACREGKWVESETYQQLLEQDRAYTLHTLSALVTYLEAILAATPAQFAPQLDDLMAKGYLFAPPGDKKQPFCSAFYYSAHQGREGTCRFMGDPQMRVLLQRLRVCWQQMLDKAQRGEIKLSPEQVKMYRENIEELDAIMK